MKRYCLSVAMLALAVLACNAPVPGQFQVVTVTPTAPPTETLPPTLTATATITYTPSPVPSPTVAPQTAVDQANTALRNGDYQSAVKSYRSILDQSALGVSPALRASATFGAGVAALREGLFEEAVTHLSQFISTYPTDSRVPQAQFLRGDAYLGTSQWQPAIDNFNAYLKARPGLLDSYAWERIGDANLALGAPELALQAYAAASQGNPRSLIPLLQLREKVAAAYLNAGNVDAAVGQYDQILKVARNDPYRASIAYAAALALDRASNGTQATARYQDIIASYPQQPEAYQAMQRLLKDGVQIDDYQRGQISFAAGDWNDAITSLYNYTTYTQSAAIDPAVFMMLGKSYREMGNTAAALTSFQTVVEQYPKSDLFGDALLEQGRTLFMAGKTAEAIDSYKALAETYPYLAQGAEALSRAGYLYALNGDQESSLATYEILGQKYPGTDQAMDALFKGGMLAFNQHQNDRAQRLFAILATTGKGTLRAAGAFWLGRIYQLSNQPDLAHDAYQEAANADPGGYYSQRASDLLTGHALLDPPMQIDWGFSDPARLAEAEGWMRQTFNLTQTGDLWALSPELRSDPRKLRGDELWAVAAYDEARAEYAGLRDENAQNPLVLYQLATYFYQIGLYREAISTAELLIQLAGVRPAQAPRYIAALAYPIAYYDLVLPLAQKYKVDPLLVFAQMRQESLFESYAQSGAAAQGLMQVIPDTGAYIAQQLNWPDYQNSDLFRPFINVEFGIFYLKEQLDSFDGNKYAALAAYNAGPGSAQEWLRVSGGDPDLFMQVVEYDETQTYLRKIYEQYQVYAAIYGVSK